MRCAKCGRSAVIWMHNLQQYFCDRCFLHSYDRKIRRTIKENNMLQKNDKIMVACSGGKDSMSLLYQIIKKNFDVTAVIINEGTDYRTECTKIVKKYCSENEIPFVEKTFKKEYGTTMERVAKQKDLPMNYCAYCGVLRRNLLNKTARELKADKVATGHNLDDESQTILMNLYRSEMKRLARCGPIIDGTSNKKFIPRIKPLRECYGKENIVHCLLRGIPFETFGCPYKKTAYRNIVRENLDELEHLHPGTKMGLLKNFDRLSPYIKKAFPEKASVCSKCGEVTSGNLCQTCKMLDSLK